METCCRSEPVAASSLPFALALAIGSAPGWIAGLERLLLHGASGPAILPALSMTAALTGSGLFAASFVLMLRVGWLERAFGGLDRLYRAHHIVGALAYLVLLIHPVALGVRYLLLDHPSSALAVAFPNPLHPALFAGWVALLWLMTLLLVTFYAPPAYRTWKWLHASSGVAFLLAIAHVAAVRHRVDWTYGLLALWASAAVVAITYRALMEHAGLYGHRYRVIRATPLAQGIVELELAPLGRPLDFATGQFVFAAFYSYRDYVGCAEYHPFTVVSRPGERSVRLVVKALGDCTTQMQHLRPGVMARIQGPYGGLFQHASPDQPQVWLAGGIGITPFLAKVNTVPREGPPIDLYYAAARSEDAVCLAELERIAARLPRLHLKTLFASKGEILSAQRIAADIGPLAEKEFLLCGPPGMIRDLSAQLRSMGVSATAIHAERFDFR